MTVLVYLRWPEACFRANRSDLDFLRSLLPPSAKVTEAKSERGFLKALPEATHVITWRFRREWYALAPKLRLLATPAAGKELIDPPLSNLQPSTFNLSHQPPTFNLHFGHYHGEIMAENVAAFCLAFSRGFFSLAGAPSAWPRAWLSHRRVFTLAGTKAVIAGYGNVGRAIGAKLAALGVEVHGLTHAECDRLFTRGTECRVHGCGAHVGAARSAADWFILALPSTTGTDDFLDAKLISKLPRRCVVINVGRGNAIDEAALVAALRRRRLAGAYLDVLKAEPSGTVPLFKGAETELAERWREVPNLFVTPHSSAFSADYLQRAFAELAADGCLK